MSFFLSATIPAAITSAITATAAPVVRLAARSGTGLAAEDFPAAREDDHETVSAAQRSPRGACILVMWVAPMMTAMTDGTMDRAFT